MKKRISFPILISIIMSFLVVVVVYAGSSYDIGTLETEPALGEVNWIAWINESKNLLSGGIPNEIMTEDGTNTDLGVNQGYAETIQGIRVWVLQVENFTDTLEADGDEIRMVFGGLGPSSGKIWNNTFTWTRSEDTTFHDPVPLSVFTESCPVITNTSVDGTIKSISFAGVPGTYLVYKSTLQSGAFNGASNGRYQFLKTVNNITGDASFTDNEPLESWYFVVRVDGTNTPIGCHSEEAFPTAVTVSGFEAAYLPETPAIKLTWETASEVNLMSFRVLRSASVSGDKEALAQLAVQNPGSLVGGSYAYQDENVLFGQTYFYWLEMIHLDGSRDLLGPLQQTVGYLVYLPLSWR